MPNQYQFKAIGTIHSRGVAYMWACKWQRVKRPVHRGIMLPITLVIVTTAVDTQTVFFFLFFSRAIFFNPSAIALTTFRFCSFKVTVNTCIFCDSDKNYFLSFLSHVGGFAICQYGSQETIFANSHHLLRRLHEHEIHYKLNRKFK